MVTFKAFIHGTPHVLLNVRSRQQIIDRAYMFDLSYYSCHIEA